MPQFFNQTSSQQYLNLKWVIFMQTHVFKLFDMKRSLIKDKRLFFCTYKVVKNKHYIGQSLCGRFFMNKPWLLAMLDPFGFLIHEEWLSFILTLTLKLFTWHQTNILTTWWKTSKASRGIHYIYLHNKQGSAHAVAAELVWLSQNATPTSWHFQDGWQELTRCHICLYRTSSRHEEWTEITPEGKCLLWCFLEQNNLYTWLFLLFYIEADLQILM